ncbi:MAG: methyltransferase domain-containing protein [Steroidobacteraceae bacterium]
MNKASAAPDGDYVLGTHDEEVERLGIQHRLWRHRVLDAWRRARIGVGQRVADIGAGPGYAAIDLAEIVGPRGEVTALERSVRFLEVMRKRAAARGLGNLTAKEIDLDEQALGIDGLDAAWCRWVLSFVRRPAVVVERIAGALKPGGRAVFHEYVDYGTWACVPPLPSHAGFVAAVMTSWRASGGEPDIAQQLPGMLAAAGLRIVVAEPVVYLLAPEDPMWEWPASYIASGRARLVELGHLTAADSQRLEREFAALTANPAARMLTPLVLEVIALKP